ncbi:hypothetical protein FNF31_06587 [Cafeteria roenbergensis]|nr:hypothetical protein FNF31_06587 [Cafeteria roenbergensis]
MEAPFLVGNRTVGRLAAGTNEAAAGAVSHFAKRQLQKFGWKEGDGLGKERQGNVKHVAVSRKDDSQGIGFSQNGDWTDQWWWGKGYGSFKVKVRRDSATSADVSSDDSDSDSDAGVVTSAELLKQMGAAAALAGRVST